MDSSEAGRQLDEALGLNPLPEKKPQSVEPKKFPPRALDWSVGQAPKIPIGPISD